MLRASSRREWIARSTALLASTVAIAVWSALAYTSARLVVVGTASVVTRMRRSPNALLCSTTLWNTTNGALMLSSISHSITYPWSSGTLGRASRSVERTKKLPWNAVGRMPRVARMRSTASKLTGLASTLLSSWEKRSASAGRAALKPG